MNTTASYTQPSHGQPHGRKKETSPSPMSTIPKSSITTSTPSNNTVTPRAAFGRNQNARNTHLVICWFKPVFLWNHEWVPKKLCRFNSALKAPNSLAWGAVRQMPNQAPGLDRPHYYFKGLKALHSCHSTLVGAISLLQSSKNYPTHTHVPGAASGIRQTYPRLI